MTVTFPVNKCPPPAVIPFVYNRGDPRLTTKQYHLRNWRGSRVGEKFTVNALPTEDGFALVPVRARDVVVLAPPTDEAHATVLALLADGEAWSSSALALALGASTRTVQRALDDLTADGKVQAVGQGRARRWMAPPVPGFPTTLLLPAGLSGG